MNALGAYLIVAILHLYDNHETIYEILQIWHCLIFISIYEHSILAILLYDVLYRCSCDVFNLSIHLDKSIQNGKYCFADKVQCRL